MEISKMVKTGRVIPPGGGGPRTTLAMPSPSDDFGKNPDKDSVLISQEAQKVQSRKKAESIVKNAPDIRETKVNEVKKKMQEGFYQADNEILERVAEKIARSFIR